VRYRVEVAGYVYFSDPLIALACIASQSFANVGHCVIGASIWPESIGVDTEVGFPYRLQDHSEGFLYNPVQQGWDAKRPLFLTVGFRDVNPLYRRWFKGFGFELFLEPLEISLEVSMKVAHCYAVCTCRFSSLVGVDGMVSYSKPHFITEQSIEVLELMFGFLSGFLTQFLLHFVDVHRYVSPVNGIDYLCIRSFRKLRAFAVGVFFYSSLPVVWTAFPSSDYYALSVTFQGRWLFGER
jgi:hypothetical protein